MPDMLSLPTDRRAEARIPIDVLANRFLDGYPHLCRATNISRTGIRLRRFQGPDLGPLLRFPFRFVGLQFQLPECEDVLTASGEVVFSDDRTGAVGVRFTFLPKGAANAIERFLVV
jgi:hypothetical protein